MEENDEKDDKLNVERRNLNQEHYQQTLNTILNLNLLQPYQNDYKNLPQIDIPSEPRFHSGRGRRERQRRILAVDIDETMIHTIDERDPRDMKGKVKIQVGGHDDSLQQIDLNVRPHLIECLQVLKEKYYILAFTASE